MKESKKTAVPLPGSKPKSKAKDAPSKSFKSQEMVGSDDDSSAENTPPPKTAAKSKTTIGIHKTNSAVKSKEKEKEKKGATSKSTSKAKPAPKKPAPKRVVTQKQAEDLSSSEQSDDSDAPARDVQTKLPGNATSKAAVSESSDSDSDSDSSSEESEEDAAQPVQQPARPSQPQSHAVDFRPVQAFEPPKGFNPLPVDARSKSKATSIFDNLEGKQVWHITAPQGVSLKDLRELAMDKAMNGEAIHSYKGADYSFSKVNHTEIGAREVLVPRQNGFKAVSAQISQTLHLQQVVRLPELSSKQADINTGSEAAASITRSTIRTPRAQVKGLKMRFRPTGFGGKDAGELGDSDSEDEQLRHPAGLGMPNGINLPSRPIRAEKRKHSDANGDEATESVSKKVKKHRTPEEIKRKEEKRAKKEKKRELESSKS